MKTPNDKTKNTESPAPAGNFIALLQGKTGGVMLHDLDEQLAHLVRTVQATRKGGTLTYKVKITPNARAGVKIDDELSVKEPKAEAGVSFFFADEHGTLLRNDPRQATLPLRSVDDDDAEQAPRIVKEA